MEKGENGKWRLKLGGKRIEKAKGRTGRGFGKEERKKWGHAS